jgi:hypothetical protein
VDFDVINQVLNRYSAFVKILKKKMELQWESTLAVYIHQENL